MRCLVSLKSLNNRYLQLVLFPVEVNIGIFDLDYYEILKMRGTLDRVSILCAKGSSTVPIRTVSSMFLVVLKHIPTELVEPIVTPIGFLEKTDR